MITYRKHLPIVYEIKMIVEDFKPVIVGQYDSIEKTKDALQKWKDKFPFKILEVIQVNRVTIEFEEFESTSNDS